MKDLGNQKHRPRWPGGKWAHTSGILRAALSARKIGSENE